MDIRNAFDLYSYIQASDLYNPRMEIYAYKYDVSGSIAVYKLNPETMKAFIKDQPDLKSYRDRLEIKPASIKADKTNPLYDPLMESNTSWCEKHYMEDGWMSIEEYKRSLEQPQKELKVQEQLALINANSSVSEETETNEFFDEIMASIEETK